MFNLAWPDALVLRSYITPLMLNTTVSPAPTGLPSAPKTVTTYCESFL